MSKSDWLALMPLATALWAAVVAQLVAFGTRPARERRKLIHVLEVLEKRALVRATPLGEDRAWEALERQARVQLNRYQYLEHERERQYLARLLYVFGTLFTIWTFASAFALVFGSSSGWFVGAITAGFVLTWVAKMLIYGQRVNEMTHVSERLGVVTLPSYIAGDDDSE